MTFKRKQPNLQASQLKDICFCWICRSPVDLETCKTDEHGMAVHGDCYLLKLWLSHRGVEIRTPHPKPLPVPFHHGTRSWHALLAF